MSTSGAMSNMMMSRVVYPLVRHVFPWYQSIRNQGSILCLLFTAMFVTFVVLSTRQDIPYGIYSSDKYCFSHLKSNRSNGSSSRGSSSNRYSILTKIRSSSTLNRQHIPNFRSPPDQGINQQKQLLLVTFGRSGSSFTSNLVSHDPGVFYSFEPLYVLQKLQNANNNRNATANDTATSLDILRTFLSCNFTHLDPTLLDNFQLRLSGAEVKGFYKCVKSVSDGVRHVQCYLRMIKQCQLKQTIFAKVIRFPMAWAEDLMLALPNLKILYLVRDPRAVLRSQAMVFRNFRWPQDLQIRAAGHCNQMKADLDIMDRLATAYPGRIRQIRYESGAMDPIGYTKDIYKFVGLDFNNRTLGHILSVTRAKGSKKDLSRPYSLVKSNALDAANHWRTNVSYDSVKIVDNACANVYSKYRYRVVTSSAHLHSKDSLFDPPTFDLYQ